MLLAWKGPVKLNVSIAESNLVAWESFMIMEEQAEEKEPKLLIIQSGQTWSQEKVKQPIRPICPG